MTLEYVCDDNGNSKWFFNKETNKFARIYPDTKSFDGCIHSRDIPDPVKLWNTRCEYYGVPLGTENTTTFHGTFLNEVVRLKPTPAVFSLWNYREAA